MELLASLTIVSIILIAFIPIFPQILSWSDKNESNLVTNNIADEFIYKFKNDPTYKTPLKEFLHETSSSDDCENPTLYDGKPQLQVQDVDYVANLTICQDPVSLEDEIGLYRVHLTVHPENEENNSIDTYFYMTSEGDSE